MKLEREDRQAVRRLSGTAEAMFKLFAEREQGEIVGVPELCRALCGNPTLVAFSCLSGDGKRTEVGQDLGVMLRERKLKTVETFLTSLRGAGYTGQFQVIIDDCEPCRVWQWRVSQAEITAWCQMLVEDAMRTLPQGWSLRLWSQLENGSGSDFDTVLEEMRQPRHAILLHQQLEHMRRFPNKKLVGDIREAAVRRLAEYALQGRVLEQKCPLAILLQAETPWRVKDALYSPLRRQRLPIVHLFPEERR